MAGGSARVKAGDKETAERKVKSAGYLIHHQNLATQALH